MRKLALAVPFVLAIAACGSDTKSCSSTSTAVQQPAASCTLRPGSSVTVTLHGTCQTCAQTTPSCVFDPATNHLDTQFQECTEDVGCGSSCQPTQPTFSCQFTTPSASGATTFYYNVGQTGSTNIQPVTITLDPGGTTSCTL